MSKYYKVRPPLDVRELERWDDEAKRWIPDDGKPGYLFSGKQKGTESNNWFPMAWYSEYAPERLRQLVMSRTCERFHCANGRKIEHPDTIARREAAEAEKRVAEVRAVERKKRLCELAKAKGMTFAEMAYGIAISWDELEKWLCFESR